MREFGTAAAEAAKTDEEVDEGWPFEVVNLDGTKTLCRAQRPTDAQYAVVMSQIGRYSKTTDQIAGIINFFVGCMDKESEVYLVQRLLDPRDKFGLEDVQDITEWLIEEWTARPTRPPSGSTPSQSTTGVSSTPPTPALT